MADQADDDIRENDAPPLADIFREGLGVIGRSISLAQGWDAKRLVWRNGLHEALVTWHGIDRLAIVDECFNLAEAKELTEHFSVDEIQHDIAAEVEWVERQPQPGNGKDHGYQYHGPDTEAEIIPPEVPIVFPFPIVGKDIPRRPWIIPGLLLRRHVTLLVAPPGSGKSLLTMQLAMVCAAGVREWGSWRPRGCARVLMINSEEDDDEMRRRLFAAADKMKLIASLGDNLAFAQSPETIVIAKADSRTKTVTRTPMVEKIVATVINHKFDILIIDPFAETFAGDENDNSELKWAAVLWREVARRTDAAVLLVHHTKKYSANMAGDMDAARGGGSLAGVARIVATLFGMSEDDATRLDLVDKRQNYLRFDDAKANLTLVTPKAKWFEKVSVTLPNAGDDGAPADEVGVLIPWQPVTAFDKMSSIQANAILDEFLRGYEDEHGKIYGDPFAPTPQRGPKPMRWGGYVIQRHLQCGESEAVEILATWITQHVVEVVQQNVKTGRKKAKDTPSDCLRVVEGMRPGRVLDRRDEMDLSRG